MKQVPKNIIYTILVFMCFFLQGYVSPNLVRLPVYFVTRTKHSYESLYGWPQPGTEIHVDIKCPLPSTPLVLPQNVKLHGIYIYHCNVPNTPLAELLTKSHIDFTELENLLFTDNYIKTPLPKDFTADLPVKSLEIWNVTNFDAPSEFFTSLTKLKQLTFGKMEVPTLPSHKLLHLENLVLKYVSVKNWDNCEHLIRLHIEGLTAQQIPKKWPISCSLLKTLHLEALPPEIVQYIGDSFNETSLLNLEALVVRNCSLKELPLQLMISENFIHLDFSDNDLDNEAVFQISAMKALKVLELSNNRFIDGKFLTRLVSKIPVIRDLKIDGIGVYGDQEISELRKGLTQLTSLEKLWMDRIYPDRDIFMHSHFEKLTFLSWTTDKPYPLQQIKLHGFPSTGAHQLEVDLRGTTAKFVSIAPEFIHNWWLQARTRQWLSNRTFKLIVKLDSVDCNCYNDLLAIFLKESPYLLAMPDLKCTNGGLFKDEPIEKLNCRTATVNKCKRRINYKDTYDFTTVVDCSGQGENFRWPQPKGFRGFNASGNYITSLDKAYLPDSLEWLDLRNNSISKLNGEQSARLFGSNGRLVWFSGNPIICECDNQPLLDALHVNQSLIQDYDHLTCAGSDKPISLVSVAELCRPRTVTLSVSISVPVVLILIAALLIRHYWIKIRVILYAHGFCLSCFEDDMDENRPYDAFLSFAHGDDEYVMGQLLPQLESEPNCFRLCVHYRDWAVGEWIPGQIMKSVHLSKRTIIVLSKNFVKSCWGMLEFRHAHAGAMVDGRQRLLVLVLDDVLSHNLPPEIQGYLELNTYLKCDDPWFWEKLLFAMPHRSKHDKQPRDYFINISRRQIMPNDETTSYV